MSFTVQNLRLNSEELRFFVLKTLKDNPETQYGMVCMNVAEKLIREGIVENPRPQNTFGGDTRLAPYDEEKVREILWDLVIERILTIGINTSNPSWPFIKLTQYGKTMVNSALPVPHDPFGYIERVKREVPGLDPIILTYLEESIKTYNINALLSTTISLGCASEKALLLLIEAYSNAIQDDGRRLKTRPRESNSKGNLMNFTNA